MKLSFIFVFIIPQLISFSNDFIGGSFANIVNKINTVVGTMNLHIVLDFSFCFILGYILNNIKLKKCERNLICISGTIEFSCTILFNAMVAWKTNEPCQTYYNNFSINVLF